MKTLLLAEVLLFACVGTSTAVGQTAEIIVRNGVIYTGDPFLGRVEALGISGDKVVVAGTLREVQAWIGPRTRVIDLKGRFLMPGFNDAHAHPVTLGLMRSRLDLRGVRSLKEMQDRIRKHVEHVRVGEWVVGRGWNHYIWPEGRRPTRADLDAGSTSHPM